MAARQPGERGGDGRGQSLVEFALTLPIIIILFVAVVVFAFMLYAHVTMSHAAREGTRYIVGSPQATNAEVEAYVKAKLGILNPSRAVISIAPPPADRDPGENVTVQISYPFQLVDIYVPYIITAGGFRMFPPIWVTAVSTMYLD
jgi:Flp pilus assembly protein TadG